jgi:hypothetical protein
LYAFSCTGSEEDGLSWQCNRGRRPAVGKNVEDCTSVPLGGEGVVEKRPGGVRRLGAGSIGVGRDRKGRSHGEAAGGGGGASSVTRFRSKLKSTSGERGSSHWGRWGRGVPGGGCQWQCRARPELKGRGGCGVWVGRSRIDKENRGTGCGDSCGVGARER